MTLSFVIPKVGGGASSAAYHPRLRKDGGTLDMSCDEARLYRTFSALHEDTDKGWVWLCLDENRGFGSRMTIRISRPDAKRSIYCEYRALDDNFVRTYDTS